MKSRQRALNKSGDLQRNLPRQPMAMNPRAERFPIQTQLRYRASGQTDWNEGTTLNISRSGVLFRAEKELQASTMLEMQILFPSEVTGGSAANVICCGPVVRTESPESLGALPAMAAAILHYRFCNQETQ